MVAGEIYQNTLLSTFNFTFLEGGETGLVGVGGESVVVAHTQCIFFSTRLLPGTRSPAVGPVPCGVQVPSNSTLDMMPCFISISYTKSKTPI